MSCSWTSACRGSDGVEATRRLPDHKVLIVTTYELDEYVVEALRAGAAGFILKDTPPDQLVDAIRVVAAGDELCSRRRSPGDCSRKSCTGCPRNGAVPPELSELTAREHEILLLIARGCSNAEIAAELFLSELTVKSHVSHVLGKLGLRDRVQAVILAYETGLVTPGDE